jgi:hypothetical protein
MVVAMTSRHPRRGTKGFEQIGAIMQRVVADMIAQRRAAAAFGVKAAANDRAMEGGAPDQEIIKFTSAQAPPHIEPS